MAWPSVYGLDGPQLRQAIQTPRRPTIFLIHDHFLTPTHLAPLHNNLLESAHRVYSPQLPSTGFQYQNSVVEADVQTLVDAAKPDLRLGLDAIFVMFGYGGVPGTLAAQRLNTWSLETPRAGRVSRFVFVSAMLLDEDEALKDVVSVSSEKFEMLENRMCRLRERQERRMFEPCSSRILPTAMSNLQHLQHQRLHNTSSTTSMDQHTFTLLDLRGRQFPTASDTGILYTTATSRQSPVCRSPISIRSFAISDAHFADGCSDFKTDKTIKSIILNLKRDQRLH